MSDFDDRLKALLSEEDEAFLQDTLDQNGYYQEAFASLKGPGSGLRIMGWVFTIAMGVGLIAAIIAFFHAETTRDQIMFASMAVFLNTAQIGMKLWFNMQLNRRAIIKEIKKLQLEVARNAAS